MADYLRASRKIGNVHFSKGVNDSDRNDIIGRMLGHLVPYKQHSYFEDFLAYDIDDWTITKVEAGSGAASLLPVDGSGGVLKITNDNAASDQVNIQLGNNSGSNGSFFFNLSESLWFDCRLKFSDISSSNIEAFIGLNTPDTSLGIFDAKDSLGFFFDSLIGSYPLFVFSNFDNGGNFEGNNDAFASANIANDEFFNISIVWNAKEKSLSAYINDILFARRRLNLSDPLGLLSLLPRQTHGMTPTLQIKNLNTATNSMSIDYIWVGQESKGRS